MSQDQRDAIERVKIGIFLQRGYPLKGGIVHVGANEGYEVEFYLKLGLKPIVCFEPLMEAAEKFWAKYKPEVAHLELLALGNIDGTALLHVTQGDGQGSSLLPELPPEYQEVNCDTVQIARFATWAADADFDPKLYDTLVIDTQGTELDVLRGMDDFIEGFRFLNIECSMVPTYGGGAFAEEVILYLARWGFKPITKIEPHNDILFVKE